jgi:hypothetical protein
VKLSAKYEAATDEFSDVDVEEILKLEPGAAQQLGERAGIAIVLEEDRSLKLGAEAITDMGDVPFARLLATDSELLAPFIFTRNSAFSTMLRSWRDTGRDTKGAMSQCATRRVPRGNKHVY